MSRVLSLVVSGLVIGVIVVGSPQTVLANRQVGGQSQMMHRHHHHHHHRHPMVANGQMGGQMMNQMNQRLANGGKPMAKPAVAKRPAKK